MSDNKRDNTSNHLRGSLQPTRGPVPLSEVALRKYQRMTLFDNKLEIIREKSILGGDAASEIEKRSSISSSKESEELLEEKFFSEFGKTETLERKSLFEKSAANSLTSKIITEESEMSKRRFTNF